MNKRLLSFASVTSLLLVSFFFAACTHEEEKQAGESPTTTTSEKELPPATKLTGTPKRYDVKSGIVKYNIQADMMEGTETLYFDDYGRTEAKYTDIQMNVPGMPPGMAEQQQLTIMRDGYLYNIDRKTNEGTKVEDTISKQMMEEMGKKDMKEVGDFAMKALDGIEKGEDTVAGYDCDLWLLQALSSTNCVYKGVSLRAETNVNGLNMLFEAESAEFDINVPKEKLEVPSGVRLSEVDMDEMMRMVEEL